MQSPYKKTVLLVEDDPQACESMEKILVHEGLAVITARDGQAALDWVRPGSDTGARVDIIITDVRMPRLGGLEFFKALRVFSKDIPVILMTAYGNVEEAVWAMKLGAVDFLSKPFKRQVLLSAVRSALERAGVRRLESDSIGVVNSAQFPGVSVVAQELRTTIDQVARTDATVLLTGESGVGKDYVARLLHTRGGRQEKPFVALNCASVPESLIESELFGHEKGAFSGAASAKVGLFEAAHGGTLFLDEIGDMPYFLQARLLRALQDGEIRRLGATQAHRVNVRIVSATNRDLEGAVSKGSFREDLLFRLDVVRIEVPPLRQRTEDIPLLAQIFLDEVGKRYNRSVKTFSEEALSFLMRYSWPGNVRELYNMIERAIVFCQGEQIELSHLPGHLMPGLLPDSESTKEQVVPIPIGMSLKEAQDLLIRKTLELTKGDKTTAARLLGVNSRTIYRKLGKKWGKDQDQSP